MFKKTLRIEQLERKDLFAGVVDGVLTDGPVEVEITSDHIRVETVDQAVLDDTVRIDVEPQRISVEAATPGDANLDGAFNQLDLVFLLQQDKYMKDEPADWGSGDFNGDGFFDRADIMFALQAGDYVGGSYAAVGGGGPVFPPLPPPDGGVGIGQGGEEGDGQTS